LHQVVVLEALRPVAHAELDAEIDSEADEQHRERDRQQVQRADQPQPHGGRERQADEQVEEHSEDDLARMQRQPQNDQHYEDGADAVHDGAVLDSRIFLDSDRDWPGQAYPCLIFVGKANIRSRLADRIGAILAGLQRTVVDHRLEFDEGALVGVREPLVTDKLAPGEIGFALVDDVLDRLTDQVEGTLCIVELDLAALDAGKTGFERPGEAADRGVACHDLDQGRGLLELSGDLGDLLGRQEKQPVLFEELAGAERLHRHEIGLVVFQLRFKGGRRRVGQLRGRRLHNGEDGGVTVERLIELDVALPPVHLVRDQRVDVGVDGEVLGGVITRPDGKEQPERRDQRGKAGTRLDDRDDNTCQHIISF